jgi:hypothetical protein
MDGLSDGVTHLTLDVEAEFTDTSEDCEKYAPGMKTGLKHLYSGTEDKQGRFQWQDTIPEDIGKAAENNGTAKWALLVRNIKVYNDPRRMLSIHSIVVQSPYLKKFLVSVLKSYPGVTIDLSRLEFSGRFEPLIHRWSELEKAISELGADTEEEYTTLSHAQLLHDVLKKEFKSMIDTLQDMRNKGVMTYEHLWTLFQPSITVFTRQNGQETAMTLVSTRYGQDPNGAPCFALTCKYVDWDGTEFGTHKIKLTISHYAGTRRIRSLNVYPLEYHNNAEAVRARLVARGDKAESLVGVHNRAYQGIAWKNGAFGTKEKYNVKGRVGSLFS